MKEIGGGVFTYPVAIRVHSAKDNVKGVGALLLDLVLPSIPAACAFLAGIEHGTLLSKGKDMVKDMDEFRFRLIVKYTNEVV